MKKEEVIAWIDNMASCVNEYRKVSNLNDELYAHYTSLDSIGMDSRVFEIVIECIKPIAVTYSPVESPIYSCHATFVYKEVKFFCFYYKKSSDESANSI